ncbi:hypothetical protein HBB16_08165 [Pseudonocardia sp. MCCB 268]|nr:hypothetical protein [Pseudonocardia cytotoxica]
MVGRSTLPVPRHRAVRGRYSGLQDAGIRVVGYIDASPDELYISAPMTLQVRPRGSLGPQACLAHREDG